MCSAEFICGVSGRSDASRPQKCMMRYLRTLTLSGFLFRDRPRTKGACFAPLDPPGLGGRPSLVPPCGVLSVAQSADSQTKKEEKRAERHGARELKTRAWRIGASIPVPPAYTDQREK